MNMVDEDADFTMSAFHGAKLALFVGDRLAVILRDDKSDIVLPNHWDMPGGGREGDEAPLECALRETFEELGVWINPKSVVWGKRFYEETGYKWFFVAYVDKAFEGRIKLGNEGQMWRLMTPAQYKKKPNHIREFAKRLDLYLSGIVSDPFKRPLRNKAEGVDGP